MPPLLVGNVLRLHTEVLGKQAVAHAGDRATNPLIVPGFDDQIAFGIENHRAVVEVARTHAHQFIVDHQDLGMDGDAAGFQTVYKGAVNTQSMEAVRVTQPS